MLRVTAYNGVSADQTVTIVPAPTAVTLSSDSVTLCVKEKMAFPVEVTQDSGKLGGLRFTSSKSKTVSVDAHTGAIAGLRRGSATITVSTSDPLAE